MVRIKMKVLVIFLLVILNYTTFGYSVDRNSAVWIVRLKPMNGTVATVRYLRELVQHYGYDYFKQVKGFPDTFALFGRKHGLGSINGKRSGSLSKPLQATDKIEWVAEQRELQRDKRDFRNFENSNSIGDDPIFNDELWDHEWYLQDRRNKRDKFWKYDLNVLPVYQMGLTGRGVRVAVLDDGIEYDHDDLATNYDPEISYDYNRDKSDPRPEKNDRSNAHGTRCAGEIAMVANNGKCGVGVAFNAKIGGIKMLGTQVFDFIEGMSLSHARGKVDIYSSSWGPLDNGAFVEGPGPLAQKALEEGVKFGRHGKGSIYVWASGNGGNYTDNCGCDGYAGSIYTITVGSVNQRGKIPWYGEKCSSIMTVTYSSGSKGDLMVTTTDINNRCTTKHTGTSASAPLAAGIIALALEANKDLTWRDVQHLIVSTSDPLPLKFNKGWIENDAGFLYNTKFGFGLMDAEKLVTSAMSWKNVPRQEKCVLRNFEIKTFVQSTFVVFNNYVCDIKFLEHVQVTVNADYYKRGALTFTLYSPKGTAAELLEPRRHDNSPNGFRGWTFMSVVTWGEDPNGSWRLSVDVVDPIKLAEARLFNTSLTLYGTSMRQFGNQLRSNLDYY